MLDFSEEDLSVAEASVRSAKAMRHFTAEQQERPNEESEQIVIKTEERYLVFLSVNTEESSAQHYRSLDY